MDIKIKEVRLTAMSNEMNTRFHEDFLLLTEKHHNPVIVEILGITDLSRLYRDAAERQKAALDIIVSSKYTRELSTKDHERDQTVMGLTATVKAIMQHHFDPAVRAAAQRLMDVIRHYKSIVHRSFDEETAAIDDLLREFARADLAADIILTGVKPWCDKLATQNGEYVVITRHKYDEKAAMPTQRMRAARKETDKYYRTIIGQAEYFVTIGWLTLQLEDFIADINVLATHYANILAKKK